MLANAVLALVALQGATATANEPIQLDLAALEIGVVHRIAVTAERPFTAILVNRLPGALYSLSKKTRPVGTVDYLQPNVPDEDAWLRTWRPEGSCLELAPVIRQVLEAKEEEQLAALLAPGGEAELALAQTTCRLALVVRDRLHSIVRRPATSSGPLDQGAGFDLTIERHDGSSTPTRTWQVHFEATALPPSAWTTPSELAWLADQIARDLAEMAAFRSKRPPGETRAEVSCEAPTTPDCALTVRFGGASDPRPQARPLADSVWSAKTWAAVAAALLGQPRQATKSVPNASSTLEALTDPQAAVMERENQRVSAWLAREIESPEAHEQAALLLCALALREAAGAFSDVRMTLARATAHLAMARALRGAAPSGPSGAFAESARLVLVGRQRDALQALDGLKPGTPAERSWANALRLRTTHDWRLLEKPLLASLLERREHYRALDLSLGDQHALLFLEQRNTERSPDWGRILISKRPRCRRQHLPSGARGARTRRGGRRVPPCPRQRAARHEAQRAAERTARPVRGQRLRREAAASSRRLGHLGALLPAPPRERHRPGGRPPALDPRTAGGSRHGLERPASEVRGSRAVPARDGLRDREPGRHEKGTEAGERRRARGSRVCATDASRMRRAQRGRGCSRRVSSVSPSPWRRTRTESACSDARSASSGSGCEKAT